jgi:uncharacterized protein (TIGR02145 family)
MKFTKYTFLLLPFISMANLQGQDYLVSFSGSGASTTVTSVKVENLTQGTNRTMNGSDILHLVAVITGIEPDGDNIKNEISLSPNPMTDYSRMQFVLPETDETIITLHDLSGRKIVQARNFLSRGQHTYRIEGLDKGIYIVSISSNKYSIRGKLVCSNSDNNGAKIIYENATLTQEKISLLKGTNGEIVMQYNPGDRLKLTGTSGNYSTVVTDVVTESKTITYNFIACSDAVTNNYSIVQIGTQTWMAENLNTTQYNDGTDIPMGLYSLTPGFCWWNNSTIADFTYGALYNWYAVNTGKLCPVYWHVPTDFEWLTLAVYLGGENVVGGKLKEILTSHWVDPNFAATNETGFTALPGGLNDGSFRARGYAGYWWSSTEIPGGSYAYYRSLYNESAGVIKIYYMLRSYYFSVRCIKDP